MVSQGGWRNLIGFDGNQQTEGVKLSQSENVIIIFIIIIININIFFLLPLVLNFPRA